MFAVGDIQATQQQQNGASPAGHLARSPDPFFIFLCYTPRCVCIF
jgi:hypothetical protein